MLAYFSLKLFKLSTGLLLVVEISSWYCMIQMNYSKSEAVAQRCSVKKVFLEISQNFQKTPVSESLFLIEPQAPGLQLY